MSVAQLRAFHLVAAAGGFSQAARESAISQSTLSGQVRLLEQGSGTTLFERKQRGVVLTSEGHALFEVTKRLFLAEEEARALLKDESSKIGGHLRVAADGAPHSLPIIQQLMKKRPRLSFSLNIANSARVMAQVLEYRADVGVTAREPSDRRLFSRSYLTVDLCVFVAQDSSWSKRPTLRISDLDGVPLVLRERGSRTREVFEENLKQHGVVLGQVTEVSSPDGVREAVAAGFGAGICAASEFGFDQRLRMLPLVDAYIPITEYVVCLEERRQLPLIRDFFDAARDTALEAKPVPALPAA